MFFSHYVLSGSNTILICSSTNNVHFVPPFFFVIKYFAGFQFEIVFIILSLSKFQFIHLFAYGSLN